MNNEHLPDFIKVGAVLTAAPRWIGALLAAEGFALPVEWLGWWIPLSAILSACMAIVEGLAFAYVFEAWRNQQDKDSDTLFWFAMFSAVVFVGVLAPYIAAQVLGVTLAQVLTSGVALGAWSVAVGLSTIAIVASVGYAQKRKGSKPVAKKETPAQPQETEPQPAADDVDNRARVIALHAQYPQYTHAQIAQKLGITRQWVGKILQHSNGRSNHA